MKKTELKAILEGKKVEMMKHTCPDGTIYKWIPRKDPDEVKQCPRCATRLWREEK